MLYAATTMWLMAVVFTAWGVHRLWCAMVPPKVVNSLLLPGTVVAGLGHVTGLLLTGGTIKGATLMRDDPTGSPQAGSNPRIRIPVLGPILVAMLPMIACSAGMYYTACYLGGELIIYMSGHTIPQSLPTTLAGGWDLLRECITLAETLLKTLLAADPKLLSVWLFSYLTVCLTVRMGPLPGTLRGATGAILVLGPLAALAGTTTDLGRNAIETGWPLLSFAVAMLLLLMIITLMARGVVGLVHVLIKPE